MFVVVSPESAVIVSSEQLAVGYIAAHVSSAPQSVSRSPWLIPNTRRAPQQSVWWM
jgi:hypothetical protein